MATVNNIQVVPVQELPVSENFEGVSLPGILDDKAVRVDFGKALEKSLEDKHLMRSDALVHLTQEAYDALSEEEKTDGTFYFIEE